MPEQNNNAVTVEDAIARLAVVEDYDPGDGPKPCVHTFVAAGFGLIGAHWSIKDARAAFERWGVEEAGPSAVAMDHGLVVVEKEPDRRAVFFETRAT